MDICTKRQRQLCQTDQAQLHTQFGEIVMKLATRILGTSILSVGLLAGPAHNALAGPKIQAIGLTTVHGAVETNPIGNRDPWVAQVFSSGNECLRIAVTVQGADLEATLVSPSGRVWQDDDGNGSLRPLIKAITDVRGWYPLVMSHFTGNVTNADFSMQIQRLASNNALCNPPTGPRVFSAIEGGKPVGQSLGTKPVGGAN